MSKDDLKNLVDKDGLPLYSSWLVDMMWPEWKSNHQAFEHFNEERMSKIGVEYREFNNRPHTLLSLEAIEDLLAQIDNGRLADFSPEKTGVVFCSCSVVDSSFHGTLRTDHLSQEKILFDIAESLNLKPLFCVNEACSGYTAALMKSQDFLENQDDIDSVIIVTSEKMSDVMDYNDAATSVIFGDLTTATLLTKKDVRGLRLLGGASCYYECYSDENRNLVSSGEEAEKILYLDDGSGTKGRSVMRMNGRATYEQALTEIPRAILLASKNLGLKSINQVLCHQANKKIIVELYNKIKGDSCFSDVLVPISMERGNVSSSSIPNLMYSMLNKPEEIVSKFDGMGINRQLVSPVKWERGMHICMASIGIGLYIRSLMLVCD